MLDAYNQIASLTRLNLAHAFGALNSTTNKLLSQVDLLRGDEAPASETLFDLAEADINALTTAITEANKAVSANQKADRSLEEIHRKLQRMRTLAEEVEYGTATGEQVESRAAEYASLAGEVGGIIGRTSHEGRLLLSGQEPVVRLDIEPLPATDLSQMPEGAADDAGKAVLEVSNARRELELKSNALAEVISEIETQQDDLLSFESQLATAQQALNTLGAVLRQLHTSSDAAAATQQNVTGSDAMRLLR